MAYVAQQQLDGYAEAVGHALWRKSTFDKRVLAQKPGEVIFNKGQLVQIYRSNLDYTFKTERKLLPKWSPPHRIVSRRLNSYTLEMLNKDLLPGSFSACRLQQFTPKEGTKLAEEQRQFMEQLIEEGRQEQEETRDVIDEAATYTHQGDVDSNTLAGGQADRDESP